MCKNKRFEVILKARKTVLGQFANFNADFPALFQSEELNPCL